MPQTDKRKELTRQIVIRIKEIIADLPDAEVIRRMTAGGEQTSLSTVRRIKAEGSEDTGFNYDLTIRPFARVFLGLGDSPVDVESLASEEAKDRATLENIISNKNLELDSLKKQYAMLEDTLTREREKTRLELDHLTGQIRGQRQQMLVKDDQLKDRDRYLGERRDFIHRLEAEKKELKAEHAAEIKRLRRIITILALVTALLAAVIISALIIDKANSGIGFFWLEEAAAHIFGSATTGESAVAIAPLLGHEM